MYSFLSHGYEAITLKIIDDSSVTVQLYGGKGTVSLQIAILSLILCTQLLQTIRTQFLDPSYNHAFIIMKFA